MATDTTFWLALGAIGVGLLLYLIEVINPGFFLAIPGTVVFGIGVLALIYPPLVVGAWAFVTIPLLAAAGTWGTLRAYRRLAPPADRPETLSVDSIIGETGRVKKAIPPEGRGLVKIRGQDWRAVSDWPLAVGEHIRVDAIDGFTLTVSPLNKE